MIAYCGSRISEHMTKTPEGYLICHDVPISRTGIQQYLGQELGFDDLYNEVVDVYREEAEVFNPAAMASFEGKAVTNEHPSEELTPANTAAYCKGHVANVRRGGGKLEGNVVADLFITDPTLIAEIEAGKREVSCGYDCCYKQRQDGRVLQTGIIGNHVAVVGEGRAGDAVAIRDSKPKFERSKHMSKKRRKDTIYARMFGAYAKDAEPEEIAEALEAMNTLTDNEPVADNEETADNEPAATDNETVAVDSGVMQKLLDTMTAINDTLQAQATDNDPLEQLVSELTDNESSVTVPAESMDEEETADEDYVGDEDVVDEDTVDEDNVGDEDYTGDNEEVADEETTDNETLPAADRKAMIRMVRQMKPVIAKLPAKDRKRATDALTSYCRQQLRKPKGRANGYTSVMKTRDASRRNRAAKGSVYSEEATRKAYQKHNPHSKYYEGGKK